MTFVTKKKNTGHMSSTNKDKKFGTFFFLGKKNTDILEKHVINNFYQ